MLRRNILIPRLLLILTVTASVLWLLPALLMATSPVRAALPTDKHDQATGPGARLPFDPALLLSTTLRTKLHPALFKQLVLSPGEQLPVLIMLRAQPELDRPEIQSATSMGERRAALVRELQATAARSQAGVLALLAAAQQADQAGAIRSLWINNAIAAHTDRATLLRIAARDDVALVRLDPYQQWIDFAFTSTLQLPTSVQWHIARIRADQVWSALNVTGTGVVVGNIDSGVDWQHPALQANYRGNSPKGLTNHLYSWFDATAMPAVYPVDGLGHGTHTMGTLAGQDGLGVAPGARWIAARVFDSQGYAADSWIHAAFQWMLAPGGDPSKAPDVLSNSWGNSDGTLLDFQPDVRLLNLAGIDTFFSNGNNGPQPGSVAAPASYPESFGVGAVDETEWLANFSSRGPSPLGGFKPDVVAPGVGIISSVPGGGYYAASGTSMAAPQVAGIAALIHSARPELTIAQTWYALTSTTQRFISSTYPNNELGWGRVDAFNAVRALQHSGVISGLVRRADTGAPIAFAGVSAESLLGTHAIEQADKFGVYLLYGPASLYTLTVSALGYESATITSLPVLTDTVTRRDVKLVPLPTGLITGRLTTLTGTVLLTGNVQVLQTPLSITARGVYSLALPAGQYVLRAQANDHRVLTATISVIVNQMTVQDFALPAAPRILLVDSGRWYNASQINYYRQALDDLGYLYTDWPVRDLGTDVPTTSTLRPYPIVIWSSPLDSPGYIGASDVISDYLWSGGHFLLSGQDVGFFDGAWANEPYYSQGLLAAFVADDATSRRLTGRHAFAGQTISIAGAGGADNQLHPDVIRSLAPPLTEAAFDYTSDQNGGQVTGWCRPYRAVYLPFGFEAITDRAVRADVMARTFETFNRPLRRNTFALMPATEQLIGPAGTTVTTTLELGNYDEAAPVAFALSANSAWPITLTPATLTLKSCESQVITITARLPSDAARDASQPATISANPIGVAGPIATATLTVKTPASVLVVQDDRWYAVDAPYRSALTANGLTYDVWRVPTAWSGVEPAAPSADRLGWYPQVIWFTGYDWFQPLTISNTQALQNYLAHDGRVLLSSQAVVNDERVADFVRETLGVLTFSNEVTITQVSGPRGHGFEAIGSQPLKLPYPNLIAALAPQPDTATGLISEQGWPIALLRETAPGRIVFMAFGFEGLPDAAQAQVMNDSVSYLSQLGRSSVTPERAMALPGETLLLTVTAHNDGTDLIKQAVFTITLPAGVTDLSGAALTWSGALDAGQTVTRVLHLKLSEGLPANTLLALPVEFRDGDRGVRFTRAAYLNLAGPEIALVYQPAEAIVRPGRVMTWTLTARNMGTLSATATLTMNAPFAQTWITDSIVWSGGQVVMASDHLRWQGVLAVNEPLTITARLTASTQLARQWYYGSASAVIERGVWQADHYVWAQPYEAMLPVIRK